MKKTILSVALACAFLLFPVAALRFTVSAGEVRDLPDNVAWVDPALRGGSVEFEFRGTEYRAESGKNAFARLSDAVEALSPRGQIWLAPGEYSESVTFKKNVTVLGPKAGIDPNARGASPEDDWTLSPDRGSGEAVLKTSWHMGVNATEKKVYDCDEITVDGIAVSGAGMFRSNYGGEGKILLTLRNVYVYGYTTANNGPFYSMSYYPDKKTNLYRRDIVLENVRIEGLNDAVAVYTTADSFTARGIYFDSQSNAKFLSCMTLSGGEGVTDPAAVLITDSRFCQKTSPVISLDFRKNAGGLPFNAGIGNRSSVSAEVSGCVFAGNAGKNTSEEDVISKMSDTANVIFTVKDNIYLGDAEKAELPAPPGMTFDLEKEVRFFGRTYAQSDAVWFNWCASGFEFSFRGSGASARLLSNAPGGDGSAYVKIYVDKDTEGRSVKLSSTSADILLAEKLDPSQTHTVRVVKRTNSRSSTAGVAGIWITDGEKADPPAAPGRLIEFVGDSLTVGYASVADVAGNTAWSTAGEDCTKTYSGTVASAFGADYDVIAVSGRGLVKNYGGSGEVLLPVLYAGLDEYNRPGKEYGFSRKADAVIVNIGTNDALAGVSGSEFASALESFIALVRKNNPDALIVFAYGLTGSSYSTVYKKTVESVNSSGDSKVCFLQLDPVPASKLSMGHPLAAGYDAAAQRLIALLSEKLGWEKTEKPGTSGTPEGSETAPGTEPAPDDLVPEPQIKNGCASFAAPAAAVAALTAAPALVKKRRKE